MSAFRIARPTRRHGDETGFSLIELMIVLLIIAILLAVAIPTYLAARDRAENRAAQEVLAHANTFALSSYAQNGTWRRTGRTGTVFPAALQANIGDAWDVGPRTILGTSQSGSLPPGTPLDEQIAEAHGTQWMLLENATKGGWCFGVLSVESASSTALTNLTGYATGAPPFDQPFPLGQVPGVGTWYAAGRQLDGSCRLGELNSGWRSTWSAADTDAGPYLNHVPLSGPGPGSGPGYGYVPPSSP